MSSLSPKTVNSKSKSKTVTSTSKPSNKPPLLSASAPTGPTTSSTHSPTNASAFPPSAPNPFDNLPRTQNAEQLNKNEKEKENSYIPIPDRKTGRPGTMDPFEVRIRFTQHLQHLNASVNSANKAAQYALKYRDMDEDLHSCILEQLERNSMNNRANIMYFIEHLCDMASREGHPDYIRMIERDILRVVDAVAPEDGSGAANIKVVRKVLAALQSKNFLLAQTVGELEECLSERDTLKEDVDSSTDVEMKDADVPSRLGTGVGISMSGAGSRTNGYGAQKFDKKQIEQRIEEDRERHKRLRETIWAVPVVPGLASKTAQQIADEDVEFGRLWQITSVVGEDDWDLFAEEREERRIAGKEWRDQRLGGD